MDGGAFLLLCAHPRHGLADGPGGPQRGVAGGVPPEPRPDRVGQLLEHGPHLDRGYVHAPPAVKPNHGEMTVLCSK